jgi:GNAT superfamily N-acetyltransferase
MDHDTGAGKARGLEIRDLKPEEFIALGRLMVEVYSGLEGFPSPAEQPGYYEMLANIGQFAGRKDARVLVAVMPEGELVGGVVYFGDMAEYGAGGTAKTVKHASGIRLLGIDPRFRGLGAGRALTEFCIQLACERRHRQVILHTTRAMQSAWAMYERMGFLRSEDLDFSWEGFPVHGFRLRLE